jgi:adenylate cyclase
MERRLAAILSADVVGYSRLIRIDEEGTLAALKTLREDIIDPKITQHHGRIVKVMGDGILAEFGSAVEAVRNAVEAQQAVAEHQADLPENRRIVFRVGINLGDVVIDGDDIHGDGVNVAARLEGLAQPGGICISGKVYEEVRDRTDFAFEDLGEQQVKNIDRPVRVWRWISQDPTTSLQTLADPKPPSLPDKPSIAVLPFDNMSGDHEQEYFADGITEDIITGLSRMRWLLVIARNTTFTLKGKAVDVTRVGRQLGVRYILEGSVRRAGDRVRISAQLLDVSSGGHIWADKFDRELTDIFSLQDEITETIIATINPEITFAEIEGAKRKRSENLDVWDQYLRALPYAHQIEQKANERAVQLLGEALSLDPEYSSAHALLAYCYTNDAYFRWSGSGRESLNSALGEARTALSLDPDDPFAHTSFAVVQIGLVQHEEAIAAATRALELDPNSALAHGVLGVALAMCGRDEAAMDALRRAFRGSPRDPMRWSWFQGQANAHFAAGRYAEAYDAARRTARLKPTWPGCHMIMAASAAHQNRMEEADSAMRELLRVAPRMSLRSVRRSPHFTRPADAKAYIDGLAKAGLPD